MIHPYRDLSWKAHNAIPKDNAYALLPISSIEQHGPHMPVGTDDFILEYVLRRLTGDPAVQPEIYALPVIHYGLSPEHMDFPGTITLSSQTLSAMIGDILSSLRQHGWQRMVLLNSHGGNKPFLHGLAQEWRRRFGLTVYVMDTCNSLYDRYAAGVMETPPALEVHAGEDETSQLLCAYPDTVHMEELEAGFGKSVGHLPGQKDSWFTAEVDPSGIIGAAHLATREKGEELTALVCRSVVEQLNAMEA